MITAHAEVINLRQIFLDYVPSVTRFCHAVLRDFAPRFPPGFGIRYYYVVMAEKMTRRFKSESNPYPLPVMGDPQDLENGPHGYRHKRNAFMNRRSASPVGLSECVNA